MGEQVVCGVKIDNVDTFHEMILYDETGRLGAGGFMWGAFGGTSIGLPPIPWDSIIKIIEPYGN